VGKRSFSANLKIEMTEKFGQNPARIFQISAVSCPERNEMKREPAGRGRSDWKERRSWGTAKVIKICYNNHML